MNLVERKRRLAKETLAMSQAETTPYEAQADTDGEDSEEADIFERK
jgi:hypothetical protein